LSRYFVTVFARSADDVRRLQQYDLDLFASTAKKGPARSSHPFLIEGLLTTEEAGTLVTNGYQVLLEDPAEVRSHTTGETLEFADWL